MTLGLGAKAKPNALRVNDTEFLIAKERKFDARGPSYSRYRS